MGADNSRTDAPAALSVYVSSEGNDAWTGSAPAPDAARTDGPKRSLEAALEALREGLKEEAADKAGARIVLRGGLHILDRPLVLTPFFPADREGSLRFEAYGDEVPVISGGRRIDNWAVDTLRGLRVWIAELPEVRAGTWNFHQLFVNGRRRRRPRLPREGLFQVAALPDLTAETKYNEGQERFVCNPGDIRPWHNLDDVEIVSLNYWIDSRMWIRSFDADKHLVTLDRKSDKRMTDDYRPGELGWYYVENVFEALCEPGQWYLDRPAGRLYYLPAEGETPENTTVIAPGLETLLRVTGSAAEPIRNVTFQGIQFSHNEFRRPANKAAFGQSAATIPAAITLEYAHACRFIDCAVTQTGTYAIGIEEGCRDCEIRGCECSDLGAGAIRVWHGSCRTAIADCVLADGGYCFLCGVGILVGNSGANKILHNLIHHFYYSGISVGWTWGYGPSSAVGNVVEYNHIHDIGQGMLSDMGGIYCLGVSTGTRIRFNLFHDIQSRGYGGWAIYTDEGSTDILIEKNIAYRTKSAVFHQHYGRDNIIRNNILAFGKEAQIARTRIENHCSFRFEHNLVLFDSGTLLSGNWSTVNAVFENNLYWDAAGRPLDFAGRTLDQWQRLGHDQRCVVADPRFVDPARGDFRLRPGSPAPTVGFEPFRLDHVGPRHDCKS